MNRKHAITISVAAGVAAIAGTVAATKSIHLGHPAASSAQASSSLVAQRGAALDRAEVALRKALSKQPPKLPPLPGKLPAAPAAGSAAPTFGPAQQAQRVVYVRPAPIIRHVPRAGGEHESDDGSEHGSAQPEHGGGGFDD